MLCFAKFERNIVGIVVYRRHASVCELLNGSDLKVIFAVYQGKERLLRLKRYRRRIKNRILYKCALEILRIVW